MLKKEFDRLIPGCLPGECIVPTPLPQCQDISLYLLNPGYLDLKLSRGQELNFMTEPFFWLFCWASGHAMARYILDNSDLVRGKRVLDFGCGSGVAAIAAALAGAKKSFACDLDPLAIHATTLNSRLNSVSVAILKDWQTPCEEVDMILAADVLYDRKNLPLLSEFTGRASEVLVADSRVKSLGFSSYRKIADIESTTIPDLNEPAKFNHVGIYFSP